MDPLVDLPLFNTANPQRATGWHPLKDKGLGGGSNPPAPPSSSGCQHIGSFCVLFVQFVQNHTQAARSPAISLDCTYYMAIEGPSTLAWAQLDVPP